MTDHLPYEPDRGRTHYDGCWQDRGHHNCAVLHARQMQRERDDANRSKAIYADDLKYFHRMCDLAGVPTGDVTLRTGWLIREAGLTLPPPDTNPGAGDGAE